MEKYILAEFGGVLRKYEMFLCDQSEYDYCAKFPDKYRRIGEILSDNTIRFHGDCPLDLSALDIAEINILANLK